MLKLLVLFTFLFGNEGIVWALDKSGASDSMGLVSNSGLVSTVDAEYKLPPLIDKLVYPDGETELWAKVWMPDTAASTSEPLPLVVFLHGNAGTCDNGNGQLDCSYTFTGKCPKGKVINSHLGYDYIAKDLAANGNLVLSINANRGISCQNAETSKDFGLISPRARLVLRHLELLKTWNDNGSPKKNMKLELKSRVDFSKVILIGHSRGGESVRLAYNLFQSESYWQKNIGPMTVKGVFEIAPVDGQSGSEVNALTIPWNVMIPMCDGDVSDMQGVKAYDRMLTHRNELPMRPKSVYMVWGANHNYFNEKWTENESLGCYGHKPIYKFNQGENQRKISHNAIKQFVGTYFSDDLKTTSAKEFDPYFPSTQSSLTRIDRDFVHSPNSIITTNMEDFSKAGNGSYGIKPISQNLKSRYLGMPYHEATRQGVFLAWNKAGDDVFYELNWSPKGSGKDISKLRTLDISLSRYYILNADSTVSTDPLPTNFSIFLLDKNGDPSKGLEIKDYYELFGPIGTGTTIDGVRPLQKTVRLSLDEFSGIDKSQIKGVRLVFNKSPAGSLLISSLRFSTHVSGEKNNDDFNPPSGPTSNPTMTLSSWGKSTFPSDLGKITNLRQFMGSLDKNTVPNFRGRSRLAKSEVLPLPSPYFNSVFDRLKTPLKLLAGQKIALWFTADDQPFLVRDELMYVTIGDQRHLVSSFGPEGQLSQAKVTLSATDYMKLKRHAPITIHYGDLASAQTLFDGGSFDASESPSN